ncbi:hypothetical protein [Mesonia aquimarina]|uniref:hypothetical protein n=1 Tax=Mesonia aquimarina TaxID=1504967 RepID=UPI000EF5DF08|nr:hypothetical protein [Mesonia aquimarina]
MIKRPLLICYLLLHLTSCKKEGTKHFSFQGNWSMLTHDSIYYEVEITNDSIYTYHIEIGTQKPIHYQSSEDFTEVTYTDGSTESFLLNKYNHDSIELISDKSNFKFIRIDSTETNFMEVSNKKEFKEYEIDYLIRKLKAFGIEHPKYLNRDSIIQRINNLV